MWAGLGSVPRRRERESTDRRAGQEKQTIKNSKMKLKTDANLTLTKTCITRLRKFQIKYGCEGFEARNNFLHRIFFIF
jgi:hypothetical protein